MGRGETGEGKTERVFSVGKNGNLIRSVFIVQIEKSVLIKPKGNAKQQLEMETVAGQLFRGS